VRRDLAPLSHVFVPVFFVMIGVNSDVTQFAEPSVLGLAAVLVVVGVVGKVVAGWAASGPGDRRLIGIGMIPRGEVGLIFAGIGLREGVLGEDLYASLLLVVLVTTLMTPPLLAMRYKRLQRGTASGVVSAEAPEGGWLRVDDDVIDLAATPPDDLAVPIAFAAATQVVSRRPGPALLDWLGGLPDGAFSWDAAGSRLLLDLLRHGNERSWRFLSVTGILERALPELAASIERRRRDPGNLDPGAVMRWSTVQLVHDELDELGARAQDRVQLARPELVVLAALLLDVTAQDDDASETTAALLARLRLPTEDAAEIMLLVAETDLLAAASHRFDALAETAITPLAIHLRTTETTDALFVLTRAQGGLEPVAERRLEQIRRFVVATIDELSEGRPHLVDVLEARRSRALSSCITARAAERVVASPRQWLLSQPPGVLAAQAASLDPVPGPHDIGVRFDPEQRRLDVVSRDRVGLLAAITDALESAGLDIVSASAATWPDDVALSVFTIGSGGPVDVEALRVGVLDRLDTASPPDRVGDATVTFDQLASPWYTVVVVEAGDRPGLLHDVTAALAGAGARIHAARVRTVDGRAEDSFEVTDERGAKLSAANQERIRALLIGDATAPAAGRGRRRR
jgi:predicted amino acid-binding ACT domain protein